ncbi:helix-turn-helix domain-containing protein [Pseudoalteromonas umbrosa]|uniref:helix-turn-helix domain-containing protein n=1 Tax=Pseudoalteromonas umbrosa TaxID=3048489 RepID=UPI0024C45A08|nr:helix-turn-helix transcriptional regulator [Pseudoalteromonas sp. B95]MDK1288513.1 helix-turn-helix transcriptional regulator [Pseudoalteromonas sp. B95]
MIGSRLKEERERLGIKQDDFAALASAKRRTLVDWEKGVTSPTAVQLAQLAEVGVDIQYVLIGKKTASTYSDQTIVEGMSSFLFDTAELGWMTKSKNIKFNEVISFALYSVKKAAGEDVKFENVKADTLNKKEG